VSTLVFFFGTEYFLGCGIQFGYASFSVSHDHRVVKRIEGRFGGLLGNKQLAHIRAAQLPNALRHAIKFRGQHADSFCASRSSADCSGTSGDPG